jgi:hypothetical protein
MAAVAIIATIEILILFLFSAKSSKPNLCLTLVFSTYCPYSAITNLESMTDRRITKTRVLLTGAIAGLLWKRNYLYTVVEYNEGFKNQLAFLWNVMHRKTKFLLTSISKCLSGKRHNDSIAIFQITSIRSGISSIFAAVLIRWISLC